MQTLVICMLWGRSQSRLNAKWVLPIHPMCGVYVHSKDKRQDYHMALGEYLYIVQRHVLYQQFMCSLVSKCFLKHHVSGCFMQLFWRSICLPFPTLPFLSLSLCLSLSISSPAWCAGFSSVHVPRHTARHISPGRFRSCLSHFGVMQWKQHWWGTWDRD